MAKKILILGGARFHGWLLAQHYDELGYAVAVLNRGNFRPSYPPAIRQIKADRLNLRQLQAALSKESFDIIIDNNAYDAEHIDALLAIIHGNCQHYILTSTIALYLKHYADHKLKESEATGILEKYHPNIKRVALGKFRAEQALAKNPDQINYTALRLPNVFGEGDFAHKLSYFYYRLREGKVLLEEEIREFNLIYVRDIIKVFDKVVENPRCFGKAINCVDPKAYTYQDFFSAIYRDLYSAEKILLAPAKQAWENHYLLPFAWHPPVDTGLMKALLGHIEFTPIEEWGPRTLQWERENFPHIPDDKEYQQNRKIELDLIKTFR